ncbi:MAG: glutamate formimidoyltransferase [Syntrophaceae bacterium]
MKVLECVPNFSEGRDTETISRLQRAASSVRGAKLLDTCTDADHNRTVLTIIGEPPALLESVLAACSEAVRLIDMRRHKGVHPRIGAVDVVPFVPLHGAEMNDAVRAAHEFGKMFSAANNVPVYFYGEAALDPCRRQLPDLRRGGYEGIKAKLCDPCWKPDCGACELNERSGATAVGAREALIAFNVNLDTGDLSIASDIARTIREANGGLPCVRAIGVPLKSRGIVQVSMNLLNYKVTSPVQAFLAVKELASRSGCSVLESELVGLVPEAALDQARAEQIKLKDFSAERILERRLDL